MATAEQSKTVPRLVIVSSEAHYVGTITKDEQASQNILETLGSREHCNSS